MQAYELSLKSPNFGDLELPVSALYLLAAPSTRGALGLLQRRAQFADLRPGPSIPRATSTIRR
jgi:hypothetical protein